MTNVLKLMAALGLLVMANTGVAQAMLEDPAEMRPTKNGCAASGDEANYVFEGDLRGGHFAWVRIRPSDTSAGPVTFAPTITAVTRDQQPTGGVIDFRGINRKGYAVYWVPKDVHYMALYTTPGEMGMEVYGQLEVCTRSKPE